jgi:hypothetical protein
MQNGWPDGFRQWANHGTETVLAQLYSLIWWKSHFNGLNLETFL